MKTSLEACEGQGSCAILPSPVYFDAIVHCKTRKERRQSGLSCRSQGTRAVQPPPCQQEPRFAWHQPAPRRNDSRCHQHGKRGGSPDPSSECKPRGLCGKLFTPNKDTERRCPTEPGFPYFLPEVASPQAWARRCAGASPPAPFQTAMADAPRPSLAPEPAG